MKLIIDTHIFLWALSNPKHIAESKRAELQTLSNTIFLSSISIAEITIKTSIGKLKFDFNPVEMAIASGFEMLDFNGEDALLLKNMPFHHKDPFDRMLIAQSIANGYPIITDDKKFKKYDCKVI